MKELLNLGKYLCGNCKQYTGERIQLSLLERFILLKVKFSPEKLSERDKKKTLKALTHRYGEGKGSDTILEAGLERIDELENVEGLCKAYNINVGLLDPVSNCSLWQPYV